ncbi:NADH:ubiquinone reductase (Na(+)-transporting) subunit B [Candidatus Aerophobetes bacterium]|uniref:Na(+)-translocating NADH-quinone reductase subunit B n=1 Tax=Aerophobetes bacterium TaxID=2030807 RepID=A0A2A4YLI5_UNCAE|nr:MAG: NADH:ubiquinone reductase (Na(+)-transporting) subunit B [Candidatus Aerophobetes bacterium]
MEKGKKTSLKEKLQPLFTALDTFSREAPISTTTGPHIRDSVDLKRWMMLVVFALVPCIIMAIWNTGVQTYVFGSSDYTLVQKYMQASHSLKGYFSFVFSNGHYLSILKLGCMAFIPVMIISYLIGGLWEGLFAVIRGHEISEGFLVTGILYALVLPPSIPYWMVAVGVSAGVVIGKELFGGTGMNILNPALTARCFLFFTFPTKMTGNVWVGTNSTKISQSLTTINADVAGNTLVDGYTQSSALNLFNISSDIKRIHIDAIATYFHKTASTYKVILAQFQKWIVKFTDKPVLGELSITDLQEFVTTPLKEGGLGLSPENFTSAFEFTKLKYSQGIFTDWNFFFGNMIGSMGETSKLGILLGGILLLVVGIVAWRTMAAMILGAIGCALLFQYGSEILGVNHGAWNPAKYNFPAYKHLLLGGFAFALVFMATEPVTAPKQNSAKWLYGIMIGVVIIVIRVINPAFPEGVMLAILFANVFSPLLDSYAIKHYRKVRCDRAKKTLQ